ncbi:HAMP domain-containing histidine kinase [bacterium]|nr:HAMP domain-containing histidine kinase [bacterium]
MNKINSEAIQLLPYLALLLVLGIFGLVSTYFANQAKYQNKITEQTSFIINELNSYRPNHKTAGDLLAKLSIQDGVSASTYANLDTYRHNSLQFHKTLQGSPHYFKYLLNRSTSFSPSLFSEISDQKTHSPFEEVLNIGYVYNQAHANPHTNPIDLETEYIQDISRAILAHNQTKNILRVSNSLRIELDSFLLKNVNSGYLKQVTLNYVWMLFFTFGCITVITATLYSRKEINKNYQVHVKKEANLKSTVRSREDTIESHSRFIGIGEVATTLAHEIKNPLQSIIAATNIITQNLETPNPNSDERIKQTAKKIESITYRIATILKDIQKLAYDASEDDLQQYSLVEVLTSARNVCHLKAKDFRVELKFDEAELSKIGNPKILCRESQIIQALTNIISNGIDASKKEEAPWVELTALKTTESIQIKVVDSGPGVPAHLRKKILEPYFTTKKPGEGTGIGISHTLEILKSHGGKLHYDESAKHTTFIVSLPLVTEENKKNENNEEDDNGKNTRKIKKIA